MFDQTDGTLTYDCPDTRRAVLTGIVTNKATLTRLSGFKLSLWCPHRVNAHTIAGKDASIWLDPRLARVGALGTSLPPSPEPRRYAHPSHTDGEAHSGRAHTHHLHRTLGATY